MKKHVIIATGAALLSTSAFATKARMTALGQDSERGSQYIQDGRNKFRNAAHVNNMNNYAVMEWGANADAEGGFFRSTGSLAYGLYMGSDHRQAAYEEYDTATGWDDVTGYNPGNELDLFIGGDAGVQWGARLNYMSGEDETSSEKRSAFGLGLGMIMGDINAYANIDISDKLEDSTPNANTESKAKLGFDLGAAYTMNNMTFHADYASNKLEATANGTTGLVEGTVSSIEVGAAQTHEISSTAMVFFAGQYSNNKVEYTDTLGGSNDNAKRTSNALTATIGFEADATSWLTWRGSVAQNIIIGSTKTEGSPVGFVPVASNGKKVTDINSTTVAAGASLTFGKLVVDGTIGSNVGSLRLDEAFTNVAVSYWF